MRHLKYDQGLQQGWGISRIQKEYFADHPRITYQMLRLKYNHSLNAQRSTDMIHRVNQVAHEMEIESKKETEIYISESEHSEHHEDEEDMAPIPSDESAAPATPPLINSISTEFNPLDIQLEETPMGYRFATSDTRPKILNVLKETYKRYLKHSFNF
jgi:uncharacterized protein YneF (UPF0154 family)